MKLSHAVVLHILSEVAYPEFTFLAASDGAGLYLQIEATGSCNVTGEPLAWRCRKWRLSQHMTKSEIVQTAFLAVMTALEHEAREKFSYRGAAIFGPHFNVDRLVGLASDPASIDARAQP